MKEIRRLSKFLEEFDSSRNLPQSYSEHSRQGKGGYDNRDTIDTWYYHARGSLEAWWS